MQKSTRNDKKDTLLVYGKNGRHPVPNLEYFKKERKKIKVQKQKNVVKENIKKQQHKMD